MESQFIVAIQPDEAKYNALVEKMMKVGRDADEMVKKFVAAGAAGSNAFKAIASDIATATKRLVGHRQSVEALIRSYQKLAAVQRAITPIKATPPPISRANAAGWQNFARTKEIVQPMTMRDVLRANPKYNWNFASSSMFAGRQDITREMLKTIFPKQQISSFPGQHPAMQKRGIIGQWNVKGNDWNLPISAYTLEAFEKKYGKKAAAMFDQRMRGFEIDKQQIAMKGNYRKKPDILFHEIGHLMSDQFLTFDEISTMYKRALKSIKRGTFKLGSGQDVSNVSEILADYSAGMMRHAFNNPGLMKYFKQNQRLNDPVHRIFQEMFKGDLWGRDRMLDPSVQNAKYALAKIKNEGLLDNIQKGFGYGTIRREKLITGKEADKFARQSEIEKFMDKTDFDKVYKKYGEAGQTKYLDHLAQKFGVTKQTISRDIKEILTRTGELERGLNKDFTADREKTRQFMTPRSQKIAEANQKKIDAEWAKHQAAQPNFELDMYKNRRRQQELIDKVAWDTIQTEKAASQKRFDAEMSNNRDRMQKRIAVEGRALEMQNQVWAKEQERLARVQKFNAAFEKAWKEQQASMRSTKAGGQYPLMQRGGSFGFGGGGGGRGGGSWSQNTPDDRGFFGKIFQSGIGQNLSALDRWGIRASGVAATIFVSQQVLQIIRSLFGPLQEYEKHLIAVRTQLGLTADQSKRFEENSRSLASKLQVAPSKTAGGIAELMMEGYTREQATAASERQILAQREMETGTFTETVNKAADAWDRLLSGFASTEGPGGVVKSSLEWIADILNGISTTIEKIEKLSKQKEPTSPNFAFSKEGKWPTFFKDFSSQNQDPDQLKSSATPSGLDWASNARSNLSESRVQAIQSKSDWADFSEAEAKLVVSAQVNKAAALAGGQYDALISAASQKYGVSENLIRSIIWHESRGNPNAVSSAGAVGLMQLIPSTARGLGVKDRTNPAENIDAGTRYLKDMLNQSNQDLEMALARYNWGPGNVDKFGMGKRPAETMNYTAGIMRDMSGESTPSWATSGRANVPFNLRNLPKSDQSSKARGMAMTMWKNFYGKLPEEAFTARSTELDTTLSELYTAMGQGSEGPLQAIREHMLEGFSIQDLQPAIAVWEDYYRILNVMSGEHVVTQKRIIEHEFQANAEIDPFKAGAIRKEKLFQLKERANKGVYEDLETIYERLGILKDEKIAHDTELINRAAKQMTERGFGKEAEKIKQRDLYQKETEEILAGDFKGLTKPKMTRLMRLFEETGYMSDNLYEAQQFMIERNTKSPQWSGYSSEAMQTQKWAETIELYKKFNKRKIEIEEAYQAESGAVSMEVYNYRKELIDMESKYYSVRTEDAARAEKLKNTRLLNLNIEFTEQRQKIWAEAYQMTGLYSSEFYQLEEERIGLLMQKYNELYGEDSPIAKSMQERLQAANKANRISGKEGTLMPGEIAEGVWNRIIADQENLARKQVDIWTGAADDISAYYNDAFFSVMKGEYDELEDVATNAITMIHRAMSDTLAEYTKSAMMDFLKGQASSSWSMIDSIKGAFGFGAGVDSEVLGKNGGAINRGGIIEAASGMSSMAVSTQSVGSIAAGTMEVAVINAGSIVAAAGGGTGSGGGAISGLLGAITSMFGGGAGVDSDILAANGGVINRGYASGGWIDEPVVGRGLVSGDSYSFAETRPEFIATENDIRSIFKNSKRGDAPRVNVTVNMGSDQNLTRQSLNQLHAAVGSAVTLAAKRNR